MTGDPVAAWHDLLDQGLAAETDGWLAARQHDCGMAFGDRPLCTVLRPRFLTPTAYHELLTMADALLGALTTAGEAALVDPRFRAAFRLADWEETLIGRIPRLPALLPFARLDAFVEPDTGIARLTECNGETPAGTGYADTLSEIFLAAPPMHRFASDWTVRPLPGMPHLLGVLLEAWRHFGGGTPSRRWRSWTGPTSPR